MDENEVKKVILPTLKPYEIYLFNVWIFLRVFILLCILIILLPEDFFPNLLGLRVFPQKYWFIAIPTHALTTMLGLTICIKGFELIKTIDDPPINDLFYHELPEKEMMKEVDYNMSEGILPDAGDINYDIVQKIMNMEDDEDNNSDNDDDNNSGSES